MNFGFYDPAIGFEPPLEAILTHEYTLMIHKRSFGNVGLLSSWISEGLAEYVADNSRDWEVREAVRTGNIIPITDTVSPVYKQDLQHMETLEKDRSLAYGLARLAERAIRIAFSHDMLIYRLAQFNQACGMLMGVIEAV